MRIVLAGGYDTQNLGDHAMLQVLLRGFEQRGERVDVTLLSRHPDRAFDREYGVESIPNLDHPSREAARGKVFVGLNGEPDASTLIGLTHRIAEADVLVIGGGRMLVDYTHGFQRGHLAYFALLVTLARSQGTPVALFAQSLEDLATESGREHLRFIVRNADHVSLREEASLDVLRRLDPSLVSERVIVIPDPAFGLELVDPYRGPKLPELPVVTADRPLLAVNLRSYAWRDGTVDAFEARVAAWLDRLRGVCPMDLLFVPQMTYDVDSPETDDRVVARRVAAAMGDTSGQFFVEEPLTVDEALGIYRRSTALLTMRRHGALFAASQGVPVLPLSCEANTDYMARSLGIEEWRVNPTADVTAGEMDRIAGLLRAPKAAAARLLQSCGEQGMRVQAYADALLELGHGSRVREEVVA